METPSPASDTLSVEDLCRSYETGAGLRPLGKRAHLSVYRLRKILVEAGVTIRPSGANGRDTSVSSFEREGRVRTIADLIVQGITHRRDLHGHANRVLGWGVELDTVDHYLMEARALLRERTTEEDEDLRAEGEARYNQLWQEAPDPRTKLEVLKDWHKYRGLYPPAKMEHSGSISFAELALSASETGPDA